MADNPRPYDQAFKSLSDADPRALLDVLGVLPDSVEAIVEPLPRDIAARPLAVDAGYFVRPSGQAPFIAVFEALSSWKDELGVRLASYGAQLGDRYKMAIRMYVLPLAKHACPGTLPQSARVEWGDVQVATRLRWILPWEIDAGLLLAKHSATLDPWVILFRHSKNQLIEVVERLISRKEDAALLRILAGMRYRKSVDEWISVLGSIDTMITRETMRESLTVQQWLHEGRVEGQLDGERRRARAMLSTLLDKRFPNLALAAAIESIDDLSVLDELFTTALEANNATTIIQAIDDATGNRS